MKNVASAYISFDGDGSARLRSSTGLDRRETRFYLADEKIANAMSRTLPPGLADLLDLAMAVYVTDRVVRRRAEGLDRHMFAWKRSLTVELPVRLLDTWERPEIQEGLRRCLEFLTEDDWEFVFVRRQRPRRSSERQRFLLPRDVRPPVQVALFSGGLDSLAGAAVSLAEPSSGSLILVSGATNPRLRAILADLAYTARRSSQRDLRPLILPLGLRQDKAQYNANERSQRSRGFLYGVLGAVAAVLAGVYEVSFFENGIGAINLPYTPAQLGTHSTRSTNPVALALLAQFVSRFTEHALTFRLPHLLTTKGEMCASLRNSPLRASIKNSVTCDSFPLRSKKAAQCGVCTSCLLRRQALWTAGLRKEDPGDLYFYDVINKPSALVDKRWHPLRDMLGQVDTFRRALGTRRPWDALSGEFPMLQEVAWSLESSRCSASLEQTQRELMSLLDRYSAEWATFPTRPPGWRFGTRDISMDWRLRHAS